MRTPAPLRVLALCTTAALAVTGCTAKHASGPTPTYYESWSPEQETEAVQGAEQAIRDYWKVFSQCLADPPNADPSCFDKVSVDDALTNNRTFLSDAQKAGLHYVGDVAYVRTDRVVAVDLSIGPNKEVQLSVCTDRESYDILMADGTSVMPSDMPRRVRSIYVVRKQTDEWQVADIKKDPEGTEC